jgi:O-antigen biosynthesis protein
VIFTALAKQGVSKLYRAWAGPDPHARPSGRMFSTLSQTWRGSRALYRHVLKSQPPVMVVTDGQPQLTGCGSITGWALGRAAAIEKVEAWVGDTLLATAVPDHDRPDVFARFPTYLSQSLAGFRLCPPVGVLPDGEYPLTVQATDAAGQVAEYRTTLVVDRFSLADDPELPPELVGSNREYQLWLRDHDWHALPAVEKGPLLSIVMPVYQPNLDHLWEAIASVCCQTYERWQLCICDDGSNDERLSNLLHHCTEHEPRVSVFVNAHNEGIAAATNRAIGLSRGEYVGFLDQDDRLHPQALQALAAAIAQQPGDVYFTDEDRLTENGWRTEPIFKPGWSKELLRGMMYLGHLCLYRRALLDQVGHCDARFDFTQDWELALRATDSPGCRVVHVPGVFYHWRQGGASAQQPINAQCHQRGEVAVRESLVRSGTEANIEPGPRPCMFHVRSTLPTPAPMVSVLIPTRDKPELLQRCLHRLRRLTDYPRLEVLVIDNGSRTTAARNYLARCPADRVLRYEMPFNHSQLNNLAANEATGEFLLLLNDDTEVLHADWLVRLIEQGLPADVGAVGAWLVYPDGRTQHNGITLGVGPVACPIGTALTQDGLDRGMGLLTREVSAVTGACLLIRKQLYLDLGGLDAETLPTSFNDVDLCLRLRERGFRIVQCPQAKLIHHESASRGRDPREASYIRVMQERWGERLQTDPYYSPFLARLRDLERGLAFAWSTPAPAPA